MVPSAWRVGLLRTVKRQKRSISDSDLSVGSVLEVDGAADGAPPVLFLVLALSGSGVKAPAVDGQVEATTLG